MREVSASNAAHQARRVPALRKRWAIGVGVGLVIALGGICVLGLSVVNLIRYGRDVSASDLPGVYHADYIYSTETLLLREDGTYIEAYAYPDGTRYENMGQWRTESGNGHLYVVLDDAIVWGPSSGQPPKGRWRLRVHRGIRGGIALKWDDPDDFVQLQKQN